MDYLGNFRAGNIVGGSLDGLSYTAGGKITLGANVDALSSADELLELGFDGDATDRSPSPKSFTNVGSVTFATAGVGGGFAATFNGTNYLRSTSAALRPASTFSLSMWVKAASYTGTEQAFFSNWQNNYGFSLGINGASGIR